MLLPITSAILQLISVSQCLFLAAKTFSDSDQTVFPHLTVMCASHGYDPLMH